MAVEITESISNYELHTPQVESCASFYNTLSGLEEIQPLRSKRH